MKRLIVILSGENGIVLLPCTPFTWSIISPAYLSQS